MQTFGKLSPKAQPEHRYSQLPSTRSVKRKSVLYIIHSALTPGINFLCTLEYMENWGIVNGGGEDFMQDSGRGELFTTKEKYLLKECYFSIFSKQIPNNVKIP